MAVHEELEAILNRLQQLREQLLVIKTQDSSAAGREGEEAQTLSAAAADERAHVERETGSTH